MALARRRSSPLPGPQHLPRFPAALAGRAGLHRLGRGADARVALPPALGDPARACPAGADSAAVRDRRDRPATGLSGTRAARAVPWLLPGLAAALRRRLLSPRQPQLAPAVVHPLRADAERCGAAVVRLDAVARRPAAARSDRARDR